MCGFLFELDESMSCGDDMTIDGHKYTTYGLINESDVRDPNI